MCLHREEEYSVAEVKRIINRCTIVSNTSNKGR